MMNRLRYTTCDRAAVVVGVGLLLGGATGCPYYQAQQARMQAMMAQAEAEAARAEAERQARLAQAQAQEQAEVGRHAEAQARREADMQRQQAEAALHRAEMQLYHYRVILAEREWSAGHGSRAQQLLDECAVPQRQWEWHYLQRGVRQETEKGVFHGQPLRGLAFTPDGKRLATLGAAEIKLWDLATSQEAGQIRALADNFATLAYHPDARQLVVGTESGAIQHRDAATGKATRSVEGNGSPVMSLSWAADGSRLAASNANGLTRVWDPAGKELFRSEAGTVSALSSDGRRLAMAGKEPGSVVIYHLGGPGEGLAWRGLTDAITALAWSPDSRDLACASKDCTVRVWDSSSGKERFTARGHTGTVTSVAFNPDGRRLASGSADQTVKLWDMPSGIETLTLRGQGKAVRAVAFSPDGRRLAAAAEDGSVRIWSAIPSDPPGK